MHRATTAGSGPSRSAKTPCQSIRTPQTTEGAAVTGRAL